MTTLLAAGPATATARDAINPCAKTWGDSAPLTADPSPGPLDDGYGDTTAVLVPWRGPGRIVRAVVRPTRTGARLVVCARGGRLRNGHPGLRAVGAPVRLPHGERLVKAAVAGPWLSWATSRPSRPSHLTVRWRRLNASGGTVAKAVRGRLTALVPATTGQVGVSVVDGPRQRVVLLQRAARTRLLVSRAVPRTRGGRGRPVPFPVWLWEPRTLAIGTRMGTADGAEWHADDPTFQNDNPATVFELATGGTAAACRPAEGVSYRAASDRLAVQVTDSSRWTWLPRASFDDRPDLMTRQHLRICTADGRPLIHRGVGSSAGMSVYETMRDPAIVGDAVLSETDAREVSHAPGVSRYQFSVYVRRQANGDRTTIDRRDAEVAVANSQAAAWVTGVGREPRRRQLWVSDASGVRQLPLEFPASRDVLLRLSGATLRVTVGTLPPERLRRPSGYGPFVLGDVTLDQTVGLAPLPASAVRLPPGSDGDVAVSATCPPDGNYHEHCERELTVEGE